MDIWDILAGAGYVLDTPGAYTRGVLAGEPGERVSGDEMLQRWGWIDENNPDEWEARDFAGPAAEMLLDPLNLIGTGLMGKMGLGVARYRKLAEATEHADELARFGAWDAARQVDEPIRNLTQERLAEVGPRYGGRPAEWQNKLLFGNSQDAAEAIADEMLMRPVPVKPIEAEWINRGGDRAGVRYFEMPGGDSIGGVVHPLRPDVSMVGYSPNAVAHESVHNIQFLYPNEAKQLEEGLGDLVDSGAMKYAGGERGLDRMKFARGDSVASVEGPATAVGQAAKHYGNDFAFDLYAGNPVSKIADFLTKEFPGVQAKDPKLVGKILDDFWSGRLKRRTALVPAGPVVDATAPRHWYTGGPAPLSPSEIGLIQSPPAPPDSRKVSALIAALLGYNATTQAQN